MTNISNCKDCIVFHKCKKIKDKNKERKEYEWWSSIPPCYLEGEIFI